MSQLGSRLDDILGKMKTFKDQLKQVSQELEGTKSLLQAMAKKNGVDFTEDDPEG
jgi:chaperonin cofactor prefoldin